MNARRHAPDRGAILPLVLVVAVVFGLVVVALARLVTTDLHAANASAERAQRKAASVGAINLGIDRLRLGQTLCGSPVGGFGTITPGLLDRNKTSTTLACTRTTTNTSDITGWSVILTGDGITTDLLRVQGGGTKRVTGPMYIRDITDITFVGGGPSLEHVDGDLWHMRGTCPGSAVGPPANYTFNPANARGPICTTAAWNQIVAAPVIPDLSGLPLNNGSTYTPSGSCRVFSPGHYTGVPQLSSNVYFQSGLYWFDNVGTISFGGQSVWFGHSGATTPVVSNAACTAARAADPNLGGTGAVALLDRNSSFSFAANAQVEFFDRTVGQYRASLIALSTSTVLASTGGEIAQVGNGSNIAAVFHGLVYAPRSIFEFGNAASDAKQQLLGGTVVSRLIIQASASASGFIISTSTTPTLVKVVITATSTSLASGATTTAQAVVDYRPDQAVTSRVAVNSLRIVDP